MRGLGFPAHPPAIVERQNPGNPVGSQGHNMAGVEERRPHLHLRHSTFQDFHDAAVHNARNNIAAMDEALRRRACRCGRSWCQRRELNPRPKAYESSALPLSYSGDTDGGNPKTKGFRCQILFDEPVQGVQGVRGSTGRSTRLVGPRPAATPWSLLFEPPGSRVC